TCVSASIAFARSCRARSLSASVAAEPVSGAPLDTENLGRSEAAAGGRLGGAFATARPLGGAPLRAASVPEAGAVVAVVDRVAALAGARACGLAARRASRAG